MTRCITALTPQRGRRGRLNLFLDGEFVCGIAQETAAEARLQVGMALDEAAVAALQRTDAAQSYLNDALRYLSYRPRSSNEIERYLRGRGADDSAIAATLERLSRARLVDDEAFARYWVENRSAFSPRGERALQAELRAKGIGAQEIETALDESGEDEPERAYQAGLKRLRALGRLDAEEFRRRMSAFLQRRGFSYETIRTATTRLWDERERGGPAAL